MKSKYLSVVVFLFSIVISVDSLADVTLDYLEATQYQVAGPVCGTSLTLNIGPIQESEYGETDGINWPWMGPPDIKAVCQSAMASCALSYEQARAERNRIMNDWNTKCQAEGCMPISTPMDSGDCMSTDFDSQSGFSPYWNGDEYVDTEVKFCFSSKAQWGSDGKFSVTWNPSKEECYDHRDDLGLKQGSGLASMTCFAPARLFAGYSTAAMTCYQW